MLPALELSIVSFEEQLMRSPTLLMKIAALKPVLGLCINFICIIYVVQYLVFSQLFDIFLVHPESKVESCPLLNCWSSVIQRCREQQQGPCEHLLLKMMRTNIRSMSLLWFTFISGFKYDLNLLCNLCFDIINLQIVEYNALTSLILMLRSEDAALHYEAVSSNLNLLLLNLILHIDLATFITFYGQQH